MNRDQPLIVITGPTASGKTKRAVDVAHALDGEIISADSRQVYCRMDIGTGKDLEEYGDVPYHLIDICPAGYKYNLYEYLRDEKEARLEIEKRGRQPILCGGTGLYVESVINGLALPEVPCNMELRDSLKTKTLQELTGILSSMKTLHNVTDIDSCQRAIRAIEIAEYYKANPEKALQATPHPLKDVIIIGVEIDREARRNRISTRLRQRIENGMIDEIRSLLDNGVSPDDLIYYGLEYKFVTMYVTGQISLQEMTTSLEIAIHQFAKRQMTWFRGMERRGHKINWLPYDMETDAFVDKVKSFIAAMS